MHIGCSEFSTSSDRPQHESDVFQEHLKQLASIVRTTDTKIHNFGINNFNKKHPNKIALKGYE